MANRVSLSQKLSALTASSQRSGSIAHLKRCLNELYKAGQRAREKERVN